MPEEFIRINTSATERGEAVKDLYELLYWACDNASPDDQPVVDVEGPGRVDLATVRKLKWNGITFKKGRKLWGVYDQVIMIRLYSYELAYLINNSGKQTVIMEMEDGGFATE